jgi:UDP-N-acetylmuramoyl-tripeptide--D-alanyl-D-alanine ligase
MLELGNQSQTEHQLICDYLSKKNIRSILVGQCYCDTKSNFDKFENTTALINHLKELNLNNYIILLKGSRGIKLEEIINKNIL